MMPFSILDLCPVPEGKTAADALHNSLDLAQHAERWGYRRFWLAEHHNMPGIASVATAVVIGYIAGGTKTIRVGSGGVMLPNHSPLAIAEQFCTLAALYPGRIDLGLGRAPGTDMATAARFGETRLPAPKVFPAMCRNLLGTSNRLEMDSESGQYRGAGQRYRCGCWARASSARNLQRNWAYPSPSRPTLRLTTCYRPWRFIGNASAPRAS